LKTISFSIRSLSMANQVKLIFGAAFIASLSDETRQEFLDVLENNSVKEIDTARLYVRFKSCRQILAH
jgi:hypothetical protein